MSRPIYPERTYALTLRTVESPTGVPAVKRLARLMKVIGRGYGFKCVSCVEVERVFKSTAKGESNAKEEK